ncbi:hypothetical protein SERLA73DRAFT_173681 [Serpula lacrymans var. lacrymans S7.3]|uniref:Uncharacterized protein n=2 Tax=Serpula lacrymans var. lacrymans TaxID=341189 RepID=F8PFP3_SERL3|nr:uncharacterized protein SERLADRAFT_454492 [Serpula lacrymans var. lacrymans S7.9]EGO04244.1 hypothetical protein SERLA73DRAFT_173681 [Serpula lacrymans var. lacrymans S7.3]EGO30181.1 hypothetical protein SERLADRAFT_454492 [Serpula lacrymans var. lacrymans S7.9]
MAVTSMAAALAASLPAPQVIPALSVSVAETIPATMSDAIDIDAEVPISCVELEGSVASSIMQHVRESSAHGLLLGLDLDGTLEVTNSFPMPNGDEEDKSTKSVVRYQSSMLRSLKEVGANDNVVGFYQAMSLGVYLSQHMIDIQVVHQEKLRHGGIAIILDLSRMGKGGLSFRAFKLNASFMNAQRKNNFGNASIINHKLTFSSVLEEIPLRLRTRAIQKSFFDVVIPTTLPATPNISAKSSAVLSHCALDLGAAGAMVNFEAAIEVMDNFRTEEGNVAYLSRQIAREKARSESYLAKRREENVARVAQGLVPHPEEDVNRLFKVTSEPSKLASMLLLGQVNAYAENLESSTCSGLLQIFSAKTKYT